MADALDVLEWSPRSMEECLLEELDWFYLVTGRAPDAVRCSSTTLDRHVAELNGRGTRGSFLPFAHAFLYRGVVVPIDHDDTLPLGSWRAS